MIQADSSGAADTITLQLSPEQAHVMERAILMSVDLEGFGFIDEPEDLDRLHVLVSTARDQLEQIEHRRPDRETTFIATPGVVRDLVRCYVGSDVDEPQVIRSMKLDQQRDHLQNTTLVYSILDQLEAD